MPSFLILEFIVAPPCEDKADPCCTNGWCAHLSNWVSSKCNQVNEPRLWASDAELSTLHQSRQESTVLFSNALTCWAALPRSDVVRSHGAVPISLFALVSERPHPLVAARDRHDTAAPGRALLSSRSCDGARQEVYAWRQVVHRT